MSAAGFVVVGNDHDIALPEKVMNSRRHFEPPRCALRAAPPGDVVATRPSAAGLDIVTVSRRLGHGSPAITLRVYAHAFSADRDQAAAKAIEAAMAART